MGALKNSKHELFVHEFLVDRNMTQAAKRAGYSEKMAHSQGSAIMKKPEVIARVKELQAEQLERLCINSDWVLLNLAEVVRKAMQAEPVMEYDPVGKEMVETGEYVFDSRGANRALELIGKTQNMFADKVDVNLSGPVTLVMEDDYGDDTAEG